MAEVPKILPNSEFNECNESEGICYIVSLGGKKRHGHPS